MKIPIVFLLALLLGSPMLAQEATPPDLADVEARRLFTYSGKMVFHQTEGGVVYHLTITHGHVRGWQYHTELKERVALVVGGWFDYEHRRLSLLVEGSRDITAEWRAQLQQFHLDLAARTLTLEHMLYSYGKTTENSEVPTAHILDVLVPAKQRP